MCIASHFQAATNIMQKNQCEYKQCAKKHKGAFRFVQILVEGQDPIVTPTRHEKVNNEKWTKCCI